MKRVGNSVVGWLLFSLLLLPLLPLILAPGAAAQDPTPALNLFAPADAAPGAPAPLDLDPAGDGGQIVSRSRTVLIDPNLLPTDPARAAEWLTLNLFDDAVLRAARDSLEVTGRGYVWLGHVDGVALSQVVLVVDGGRVTGNVTTPEALYQVRPAAGGRHVVRQIDQSAFPPEAEPLLVDLPAEAGGPAAPEAPATPGDDGSTIDVLVAYTPAARGSAGGTAAIQDLIYLAVAEGNATYANSAINQRLRLVHAAEISYGESGDILLELSRLQQAGDGYMDPVHAWRDTYGADEVVLLVDNGGGYCGISYMMSVVDGGFAPWAFAVVQLDCATGYYSFAHELGHNMGARHDWYVDGNTTPYSHAHGYVNSFNRWRTVMAYDSECTDAGYNCTRLPYWSNPDVWYGGVPMGIPEGSGSGCVPGVPHPYCDADNRSTLNKTAYTVANFRQSTGAPPNAPSGLFATATAPGTIALSWSDNSGDESGFEIERSPDGAGNWAWISSTGANVSTFTDAGLASNTRYYYRVRAFNAHGASGYSSVANALTLSGAGPLVFGGLRVDDDAAGASSGDGDGFPECGETIELFARLTNAGATAGNVVGTLDSTDPYVTWPGGFLSSYGSIAAGGWATNDVAFELALSAATPHNHLVPLALQSLATNGGPWVSNFNLLVRCSSQPTHLVFLPAAARDYTGGFYSQFSGTADGWQVQSGYWWIDSVDWYTTGGLPGAWATAGHNGTFADLDYQVELMRSGCENCSHGLLVRGTPQPLGTVNRWAGGYGFYLTREGSFAVFRYGSGDPIPLQNWTPAASAHTGGSWNTLRVVASGSRLFFYVNGELVWLGEDTTYAAGQVGLALYRDGDSFYNQIWVDSARLTAPLPTALATTLSARQQALNAAAGDDPPASDGLAR